MLRGGDGAITVDELLAAVRSRLDLTTNNEQPHHERPAGHGHLLFIPGSAPPYPRNQSEEANHTWRLKAVRAR